MGRPLALRSGHDAEEALVQLAVVENDRSTELVGIPGVVAVRRRMIQFDDEQRHAEHSGQQRELLARRRAVRPRARQEADRLRLLFVRQPGFTHLGMQMRDERAHQLAQSRIRVVAEAGQHLVGQACRGRGHRALPSTRRSQCGAGAGFRAQQASEHEQLTVRSCVVAQTGRIAIGARALPSARCVRSQGLAGDTVQFN